MLLLLFLLLYLTYIYWTVFVFAATSPKAYAQKVRSVSPSASHLISKHLTGDKRLEK